VSATLTLPVAIHLATVVPALAIGAWQLAAPKGTRPHRVLGWIWIVAMAVTAVTSFWITGIHSGGRLSVIHALSVFVLLNLAASLWYVRRGNVRAHKKFMVGTMLGVLGAGIGALMPGRFLSQLFL
jgi:uncharacterized membrane protein